MDRAVTVEFIKKTSTQVQGSCLFHCVTEMTADFFKYFQYNNLTNHGNRNPPYHIDK